MLVTRTGLSPVMVGRDPELAQLRRLAAEVSTPTIALIGGEPGIGKTRLASELVSSVSPGTTLLLGQADPAGFGQPYQLLRDLAGDRQPELTAAVFDGDADPVARARSARDLLQELVGGRPAVLVVDDLHWADPESLAVFEQLDEVTDGPLLLVATYRPEELSRRHPLTSALERLDRRRGVTHLRLGRLTPIDIARFLAAVYGRTPAGGSPSGRTSGGRTPAGTAPAVATRAGRAPSPKHVSHRAVTALHHRTGGNPFFLEELLKAAGDATLDEIHTLPLPWNLAEALRSQLDGLEPEARQVVEAAAVLGARVSFDLLATVTGLAEPAMVAALRGLVDRGLLVEAEDDQFGFRHALTREAVSGELLARQRRRLHEAALAALLAAPEPDLAAVAVHARGAGRYDDMIAAARHAAADRLAAGSPYSALTLAELALEEAPDDLELLELAGKAASNAGFEKDARRYATRALRAATDDAQRVAALTQLIRVTWRLRELADLDAYAEQVRALLDTLPDGEVQARAMAALAQSYMLRHGPGDPVAWADRAAVAAERHGLKEVRLQALVEKGSALLKAPETAAEGERLLTEVAAEADHAGAYLTAARGWHNLFWCLPPGAGRTAAELLERMRASAERAGVAGMAQSVYHEGRSWLAHLAGDLDAAIAVLEEARRVDRNLTVADPASGAPVALQLGLSDAAKLGGWLTQLYLERGDLDAAEAVLAETPAGPGGRGLGTALWFQLACWRGDLETARKKLAALLAGTPTMRPHVATLHNELSAGLAAGLPAETLQPLADRARDPKGTEEGPDHPIVDLIGAQLAEAEQRDQEALAGYEVAAAATDPTITPAYLGTAAVGAARCLVRLGRLDEARAQVAAAQPHLARWSGWRRAELEAVVRRLSPGAGVVNGDAALTPREREVAALLADGLTNSEIAHRLVISRKTVAVHVSHILAKLEMSSRTQVAAWVARQTPS